MTVYGTRYALRGVIYGGGFHFTSRIVSKDQHVYRYDGIHDRKAQHEGHFRDIKDSIGTLQNRLAIMYIFCKA